MRGVDAGSPAVIRSAKLRDFSYWPRPRLRHRAVKRQTSHVSFVAAGLPRAHMAWPGRAYEMPFSTFLVKNYQPRHAEKAKHARVKFSRDISVAFSISSARCLDDDCHGRYYHRI